MLKYSIFILLFSCLIPKCASQMVANKLITTKTFMFWPNATVPFYINPEHFDHEQAMAIMTSLSMFAFKTCIKFAPVMAAPNENQHVMTFINPEGVKRCRIHNRGHSNYHPHLILLGYECLLSPEIDMIIMRALGFPFEHNRMSRDVYIDVMIENIEPSSIELFTRDSVLPPELRALPYDINSVMHFGERDYSKNGHRTIIFKNHSIRQHRGGLSATDLRKLELVYGPECRARDRREKIELCQSYPGVARRKREIEPPANRSLRVNRDITAPPALLTAITADTNTDEPQGLAENITDVDDLEYITDSLSSLGLAKETDDVIERVNKLSSLALKNAREKYCTTNTTSKLDLNEDIENKKRTNASDILGIIEVIADFAKSLVDNAVRNLTAFCQNSVSIEEYQRQYKFGLDTLCPKSYSVTKSGTVRESTQHEPDRHGDNVNKFSYGRKQRGTDDEITTPSVKPSRTKREVTNTIDTPSEEIKEKKPSKEKKTLKGKATAIKKEKLGILNDDLASVSKSNDLPRRYFEERRYKVKNPQDVSDTEWEESNISIDKDKEKPGDQGVDLEAKNQEEDQKEREIELAAVKTINKEELVKEVISEGLDSILDSGKVQKEVTTKKTVQDDDGGKVPKTEKVVIIENDSKPAKKAASEDDISTVSENDDEETAQDEEYIEIETATERKKRRKIKADEQVLESKETESEEDESKSNTSNITEDVVRLEKGERSRIGFIPTVVKLNKLNQEFYDERKWPDGIIFYVIKKVPGYDIENLRSRLAEVNNILTEKTCVRLREVHDAKEARGFDDYLILDTSPDYVTGMVGGKQIFGCVELFMGGQHRQHTAMMVMAMLGFYFEVSRHDRDRHIRVHNRHVRPDKLHHFEKIRDEATIDVPYDYKSATHPSWQFWRKIGKTGISTVATYKEQDPDGSVMRSLGQNPNLLSDYDIIRINSVYGVKCFHNERSSNKVRKKHSEPLQA